MPSAREKREYRVADAGRRTAEHKTLDRPSLELPEGLSLWNPKEAAYEIDILPYVVGKGQKRFSSNNFAQIGELYFERTYFGHRDVGPNNDMVCCPAKCFQKGGVPKRCPVCEHRNELAQDPKTDKKVIKALIPKERQLFLVLDHADLKKGIQLWEISFHLFGKNLDRKIKNAPESKKAAYLNFFHPTKGLSLRVLGEAKSIEGGKPFNEYTVDEFMERKPLKTEYIEHGICLDDIPVEVEYKTLYKLYHQQAEGADDSGEDEDDPPTRNGRPKPKASAEDEDEDDEEDEDEEEDSNFEFAVGDVVTWVYKGKKKTGKVVKLNMKKGLAEVRVKGQEDPSVVDIDELEPPAKAQDDDDDDYTPKKGGKKAVVDDDDEEESDTEGEEDEEAEEDDEEEEDETPLRGGKSRASDDDDDDEEESDTEGEEDEEEEEEEPAPKKGKKTSKK
jgi:hypothetical protein